MRRSFTCLVLAAAAMSGACSDATAPGNASAADRTEIIGLLEESGWFSETFGTDSATSDATLSVTAAFSPSVVAAVDTVPLTQRWGRVFHTATNRTREIEVSGDTATVTWTVRFANGEFLLDRTRDAQVNPTSKPMDVSETMSATLLRRAEVDSAGRHWQLLTLTPGRLVNSATDRRTVQITGIDVAVNGAVVKSITDASTREALGNLLDIQVGDTIRVTAHVSNSTGTGNVPETFVFLHLFHAGPQARGWLRVPMEPQGDGTWVRQWVARFDGRQRMMVDAIDSQTFNSDTDDDYRAEVWGVPYRIH